MTISSKDGLIAQEHFFNKLVSSKDLSGYYLLKKGEFAYNKSYSVGYDFGSIKRLELYEKGALSTLYICFSVKYFRPEYIRYYFDSLKWYKEIYLIAAEGARNHGLLNVPTESFFETKHLLSTNLMEQAKIANFLSLIDKRIEKQRLLVESLKKYKRGLLSAIFEQKHRFKDENGNDYPEWIYTTIKSALNYEQPQKYIVKTENYNDNYDTPVLTANKAFVLGYTDEKDGIYNKGNVIIYDDFTMDFKFVEFNFKVKSSTIKMLTAKENYNLYFIFNLLTHLNLKPQGHQRSYISILEPMEFLCPTFKEQNKIASFLYDIDKKIEQQFKYLNKLEFTKKGLLQQMFI